MDKKVAERTNVLTETENKSFIHAVINAVTKGYADNTVLEDVLDLIRRKEISKGVIQSAPEALKSYGESIKNSLDFLAEQIEQFEIIDEPTVKRREAPKKIEENVVEEEMKNEDVPEAPEAENPEDEEASSQVPGTTGTASKKSSIEKFASMKVAEDWDKYTYDEKTNSMVGILKLNFCQDMSKFQSDDKVILAKEDIDEVLNRIYGYYSTEYKNLKAGLSTEIFKSDIKFSNIQKGLAEVEYEIQGAF